MDVKLTWRADGVTKTSDRKETEDYRITAEKKEGRRRIVIFPKKKITIEKASLSFPYRFDRRDQFFVNGYQSWTDTREYDWGGELHSLDRVPGFIKEKYHFPAYGDAWFREYKKGDLHGFTCAYVRHADGTADFFGSFNEEHAYLVIICHKKENRIELESDCPGRVTEEPFPLFDFVMDRGRPAEVLRRYFTACGRCGAPAVRGYTSWYNYYQDISEEKILGALAHTDSSHFDLFQIDDGYETFV